jgi:hypothetical protein
VAPAKPQVVAVANQTTPFPPPRHASCQGRTRTAADHRGRQPDNSYPRPQRELSEGFVAVVGVVVDDAPVANSHECSDVCRKGLALPEGTGVDPNRSGPGGAYARPVTVDHHLVDVECLLGKQRFAGAESSQDLFWLPDRSPKLT